MPTEPHRAGWELSRTYFTFTKPTVIHTLPMAQDSHFPNTCWLTDWAEGHETRPQQQRVNGGKRETRRCKGRRGTLTKTGRKKKRWGGLQRKSEKTRTTQGLLSFNVLHTHVCVCACVWFHLFVGCSAQGARHCLLQGSPWECWGSGLEFFSPLQASVSIETKNSCFQ